MPLMLDAPMEVDLQDVDDLFGDAVGVGDGDDVDVGVDVRLAMQVRPSSKELHQRLDQLRSRGCCQMIAWSRAGTIASISPDGKSVEFRFLRCHPQNGSWQLSEPTTCDIVSGSDSAPLVHLAWAPNLTPELAIIDSVGRVIFISFPFTLNRPFLSRKWEGEPNDLHAVVGCYWLNLSPHGRQYNVFHGPAVKDGASYRYETSFVHAFGPFHPNQSRSALVCVTANGLLKLYWYQNNNKMEDTTMELESINVSDDQITHAAICSDKNVLIIVLATASRQLRVVRLHIDWGLPQTEQKPLGSIPFHPVLMEQHVAVSSWLQNNPSESHLDPAMCQLSHLEVVASTPQGAQGRASPVILAIRSYLPPPDSPYQDVQSVIDRWEIVSEKKPSLHPAFENLGSRRASVVGDPLPSTVLRKLDPIVTNKIVINVSTTQFGRVVCIAYADGTVEYRDRITMEETYNEITLDRVTTLNQVGFTFAEETPCVSMAFSPTHCSIAQICADGKVRWNGLRYPLGDIGNSNQDAQYAAVIAGLTVAASAATYYTVSLDDILAVARPYAVKPRFTVDWINDIIRMLKISVDYSEDSHHDNLVRNALLQLCLSILNHLGFRGESEPRSFGSKFAMLALNARNIVILITIASNTPVAVKEKLSPLDEPEVVDALSGCARWSLKLLSWLSDCLFSLLDDADFTERLAPPKFAGMNQYLLDRNDVSLHLLLCSSTRGLLVAVCRRLMHLEALSNRAIEFWEIKLSQQGDLGRMPTSALYNAYRRMHDITSSSHVKVQEFDQLLSMLGSDIRSAYARSLPAIVSKKANQAPPQPGAAVNKQFETSIKNLQAQFEQTMLLGGPAPPVFLPVIVKFFKAELVKFRAKPDTDPATLFFEDYSLLEVEDDRKGLANRAARNAYVDVFKRVELVAPQGGQRSSDGAIDGKASSGGTTVQGTNGSGQWRRCTRCTAVMEDVFGQRPGFSFVLGQQKKCSCGGYWGLLPRGSMIN